MIIKPRFLTVPVVAAMLFFPSRSYAQFNPAELPYNLKGFLTQPGVPDSLDLFGYNQRNDSLVARAKTTHAKTINSSGDTVSTGGYFSFVILTDKASTPNFEEGPRQGDTLYFEAKLSDNKIYTLTPTKSPVVHTPGAVENVDMDIGLPTSIDDIANNAVDGMANNIPAQFILYQNYPNPFNPATTIRYELLRRGHVLLEVYDILGQRITTLANEQQDAGLHEVVFKAERLSSGIYFLHMMSGAYAATKRMMFLK